MASILNFQPLDEDDAALEAAASVLGKAAAPTRVPVNFGSILGQVAGAVGNARRQTGLQNQEMALRQEQIAGQRALRDEQQRKLAEEVAERKRVAESKAKFQSILSTSQQRGDPLDEISILGAGLQSGAFGPQETTQFMSRVMEKKAERERKAEEFRLKLEDTKISREEREKFQRELVNLRGEMSQDLARLTAALRDDPSPRPVTVMRDGKAVVIDARNDRVIGDAPPITGQQKSDAERNKVQNSADRAEALVDRLAKMLKENPRSTTGMLSGPTRGLENVVNAIAPGAAGSQATMAKQTKEALIQEFVTAGGGSYGRLTERDMQRIDAIVGAFEKGTPEAMEQGLNDARDYIDILRGKPARSLAGKKGDATKDTTKDKFEVGKVYKDASGNKARYKGNGQWEEVQARQYGGDVSADKPYLVGEQGPEVFVPKQSGEIVPNTTLRAAQGDVRAIDNQQLDWHGRSPDDPAFGERRSDAHWQMQSHIDHLAARAATASKLRKQGKLKGSGYENDLERFKQFFGEDYDVLMTDWGK